MKLVIFSLCVCTYRWWCVSLWACMCVFSHLFACPSGCVCVCVCVCTFSGLNMSFNECVFSHLLSLWPFLDVGVCVCVCVCVCVYIYIFIYMIQQHVRVCVSVYLCMHLSVCALLVCVCVCVCIHKCQSHRVGRCLPRSQWASPWQRH